MTRKMIKPENDSSAEKSEARNQRFQTEPIAN
jgi:hypothetical protein